jgi:hypothetical protein
MQPSAAWEMKVVDYTLTMLKYRRPDLLKEIKQQLKEEYNEHGHRFPKDIGEEGKTHRCPSCGKIREDRN